MNAEIIIRHMVAGFLVLDARWVVRVANPRASTLLRSPGHQLVGKTIWECMPGLAGSEGERELRRLPGGRVERRFEFFSPSLYNWFEMWGVPAGDEVYVYLTDVTDRARAMQSDAVRESLRRVLMDAPVAISITRGADHRYELMNNALRAMLGGRSLEGLTARNALPEVDDALFDMLDRVYASGEPLTLQDLVVTYDREGNGTLYSGTFDVTYQPLRDTDGSVGGIISTAVETTTYARARRELAASSQLPDAPSH